VRGVTRRPAERRGRARRSARRHGRDNSSSSSTTDVSRCAFRATLTPSTVREGTPGIDPRAQPTPDSAGGEQGGGEARELPRSIDPGYPTQLFSATGPEAEGWPTQATLTPPTRVASPRIVMNHPYCRMIFDCKTYALENKSVVYTLRQARTLGRRKNPVNMSLCWSSMRRIHSCSAGLASGRSTSSTCGGAAGGSAAGRVPPFPGSWDRAGGTGPLSFNVAAPGLRPDVKSHRFPETALTKPSASTGVVKAGAGVVPWGARWGTYTTPVVSS